MQFEVLWIDEENFSETQKAVKYRLEQLKIEQKDILRTRLLLEEIFFSMIENGEVQQVKVQVVKNFFGKVQIKMTAEGFSYNPIVEVTDWNEDDEDEDYFRMMILKANRQRLNWSRNQNFNVVTIDVRSESNKQLWILAACIVGGIVCGIVMKEFLSPEAIAFITENFITPIQTMFLNALNMIVTPLIFFSIISGITDMGAGASIGKIGSKLVIFFACTALIATVMTLLVTWLAFSGDVPQIGSTVSGDQVEVYEFSMIKFIVDIIPANLVKPVAEGNMLQIIFLAVLFGSCLNVLGDKVKLLKDFVSNCNEFFMKVVSVILVFVPPIAFFSMVLLVLETGSNTLLTIAKLLAVQIVISVFMVGVYMLIISLGGKISPMPFLKKSPVLLPAAFATGSSMAVMPAMMNLCIEKLGVSPKISSFAVPLAVLLNLVSACIYLSSTVIMLLKMYGVEADLHTFLLVAVLTMMMSLGVPAIPSALVICTVTIAAMFGVPGAAAGLVFCIDAFSDRICTCLNVLGDTAVAVFLGRTENLLDEKIYFEN